MSPSLVRQLSDLGYSSLSSEELTQTRIHGVTPEYIREANDKAGSRLDLEEIIEMKIWGWKGDRHSI